MVHSSGDDIWLHDVGFKHACLGRLVDETCWVLRGSRLWQQGRPP